MKTYIYFFLKHPILLGICLLIMGGMAAYHAKASSIDLKFENINTQVGKIFTLPVTLDPGDTSQYTVRFSLIFPPELIEVTSFVFDQNWLAISQPGYDILDNIGGKINKTAGFPKGFSVPVSFGIVTFRVKGSGDGTISVGSESFVLDAENKNTLESRPQVQVNSVEGSVPPVPKAVSPQPIPSFPSTGESIPVTSPAPQIQVTNAEKQPEIERVFEGEPLPYGGIAILTAICMLLLSYVIFKCYRRAKIIPFDYSGIPRSMRAFYEILSDTIMEMRHRVGNDALLIASHIDGLKINMKTGRVIALTLPYAKVIASLVSEYETRLGKKVSFSFRQEKRGV